MATTIYFVAAHGSGRLQVAVEEKPDEVARLFEDARGVVALTSEAGRIYVNPDAVAYFQAGGPDGR